MAAVINSIRARLRLVGQTSARPVPSPRSVPDVPSVKRRRPQPLKRDTHFHFWWPQQLRWLRLSRGARASDSSGLVHVGCPSKTSRNADLCLESANLFFGRQIFIISASLPLYFNKSVIQTPPLLDNIPPLPRSSSPKSRWPAGEMIWFQIKVFSLMSPCLAFAARRL